MKNKSNIFKEFGIKLQDKIREISENKTNLFMVLILFIVILYLSTHYKKIFFITLLTVVGSLSLIYVRFIKQAYVLGVELVMFATIVCGYAYGSLLGAIVGFITITVSQFYSGRFKISTLISIIMVPFIGFISHYFNFIEIQKLGIILIIIYDLIILPLYYITGSRLSSVVIYFITHILFNFWIFNNIAPVVLNIIK